jgi:K+-transporting ATPase KdpF subunit
LCSTLGRKTVTVAIEYILTGLVALFVGIYLFVALLRPEKF